MKSSTRQSKFLSYLLRHRPDAIGLKLDAHGWADVAELLNRAAAAGMAMSRDELERLVAANDKQRFAFSGDRMPPRHSRFPGSSVKQAVRQSSTR